MKEERLSNDPDHISYDLLLVTSLLFSFKKEINFI